MRATHTPTKIELSLVLGAIFLFALGWALPAGAAPKSTDPLGTYSPADYEPLPGSLVVVKDGRPDVVPGFDVESLAPAQYTETLVANYEICVWEEALPDIDDLRPARRTLVDDRVQAMYGKMPWLHYFNWKRFTNIDYDTLEDQFEIELDRCGLFLRWVERNLPWGLQHAPKSMIVNGKLRSGIAVLREDPATFEEKLREAYRAGLKVRRNPMDSDDFDREFRPWLYEPFVPFWMEDIKHGYFPEGHTKAFYDRRTELYESLMDWYEDHRKKVGQALP